MSRSRTPKPRRSSSARSSPSDATLAPTAAVPDTCAVELTSELRSLRLPALRARFKDVFGRATRSADRGAIASKLAAELARREQSTAAAPVAEPTPAPRRGRVGRFTGMTLEQLQEVFVRTLGRASGSTDRRYLEWKIREAGKGRVPIGPIERRAGLPAGEMMTTPWRLPRATVAKLDEAWRRERLASRTALVALAVGEFFARRGEADAAALFGVRSSGPTDSASFGPSNAITRPRET